ncbi:MAG TPA: MFS transporter [Alphaproteobacteria bacterium]
MNRVPLATLSAEFNRLAWSNLAAQSAEQINLAAVPIVAVLALNAGAGQTGFLSAAQTLPFLLLSLPIGLLVDRVPRRLVMVIAEVLRTLALGAFPILAALGMLSVPLLAILGFAGAAGTVAFSIAAPSLVQAIVGRDALAAANGRLELARSAAFAAGPALAGALVAWTGASPAFLLAALLSGTAAILLARIREPLRPRQPRRNAMHELREGAGFAWGHPLLRPILLTAIVWNLSWFVLQAAYVPYAVHVLGLSARGVGATLGAYGAGMVVGAMLAPRIARRISFGLLIALGPLASVVAGMIMIASLARPVSLLPAAAFFLFGAGPILWTIGQTTLRQAVTPAALLGRVSALATMATTGARPIGAAIGGFVGAEYGLTNCILLSALGFLVQALVIMVSPVPRLEKVPHAVA